MEKITLTDLQKRIINQKIKEARIHLFVEKSRTILLDFWKIKCYSINIISKFNKYFYFKKIYSKKLSKRFKFANMYISKFSKYINILFYNKNKFKSQILYN